jgi:GNAT superfamily N-acetyltransferase
MITLVDRWKLTPIELFSCFVPTAAREPDYVGETPDPFNCPKLPLDGTSYRYQLAVSSSTKNTEVMKIWLSRPNLPRSADTRSGVVVHDGGTIIGAHIVLGHRPRAMRTTWVHKDYRSQGLATRMIEQWYRETPGVAGIGIQSINLNAAKAFLSAHENLVTWAQGQGLSVPKRVNAAITAGTERAQILQKFEAIP